MIFIANTNDVEDLKWLDHLVASTGGYSRLDLNHPGGDSSKVPYGAMWDAVERGTMYIKIDDDVVRKPRKVDLEPANQDRRRSLLITLPLPVWSPPKLSTPRIS